MNEEELRKEANEYAKEIKNKYVYMDYVRASALGYLAGAEPRDKRIEELEKENDKLEKENEELAGQKASLERWFGEAKRILKGIIDTPMYNQMGGETYENEEYKELITEAEQFLEVN